MRDALGSVQSVLVLGGNSEIALAIIDRLVASRCKKVVLGVRSPASATTTLNRLRSAGVDADTVVFDALDPASHTKVIDAAAERMGDIDMVILAFGILDGHAEIDTDPVFAAQVIQTNFGGAVSAGLASAVQLRKQGHGTILSITSVAGVRSRAENMIYASSKAGMDSFSQALGDALIGTGARCVVVRPGFVHTHTHDRRHEASTVCNDSRQNRRHRHQRPPEKQGNHLGAVNHDAHVPYPPPPSPFPVAQGKRHLR